MPDTVRTNSGPRQRRDGVEPYRRTQFAAGVTGLALIVGSVIGLELFVSWGRVVMWSEAANVALSDDRRGAWTILRESTGSLVIPLLVISGMCIARIIWRRSRRHSLAYMITGVSANALSEGIKHGALPGMGALNHISGHAGVAGAVCLGFLGYWPGSVRRPAVALNALIMTLVGSAVLLAGWHVWAEVICPWTLVAGCVVLGISVVRPAGSGARSPAAGLAMALAMATVVPILTFFTWQDEWFARHQWAGIAGILCLVVAAAVGNIGVVLVARDVVHRGFWRSHRQTGRTRSVEAG